MKKALALVFAIMTLPAFACDGEAQFSGKVTNVVVKENSVTYQIKLTAPSKENPFCPIQDVEVEAAVIEVAGQSTISEGDSISGYLVYDAKTQTYSVE